eukprot:352088-Chlamydomonas_euryale.AAC.19
MSAAALRAYAGASRAAVPVTPRTERAGPRHNRRGNISGAASPSSLPFLQPPVSASLPLDCWPHEAAQLVQLLAALAAPFRRRIIRPRHLGLVRPDTRAAAAAAHGWLPFGLPRTAEPATKVGVRRTSAPQVESCDGKRRRGGKRPTGARHVG